MTTPQKTIDYDAVYNELVKSVKDDPSGIYRFQPEENGNRHLQKYFRDLRTIFMGGTRQTGRSTWIAKMLERDPRCIAVVVNLTLRNHILTLVDDPDKIKDRVFTAREVRHELNRKNAASLHNLRDYQTVLVDDSTYLFQNYLKRIELYSWISKENDLDRHIVMVG